MSKRNKINKVSSYSSDSDEMMRMVKILGILVGIFLVFYLVFAYFNGEFSSKDTKEQQEIQNVEIIAGTTFSRSDSEYYVLFYDFDGDMASKYSTLYSIYTNNVGRYKIFLVDLSNKFNANYITDDVKNVNINSVESLKVVDGTLIKVENNNGASYKTGFDAIEKELFNK